MSADRPDRPPEGARCASCGADLAQRRVFRLRGRDGPLWKCVPCGFVDRALIGRSTGVAVLVGTVLIALNQGDLLLSGTFPWETDWYKLPLTYAVPFCVATYGALANGYRGAVAEAPR